MFAMMHGIQSVSFSFFIYKDVSSTSNSTLFRQVVSTLRTEQYVCTCTFSHLFTQLVRPVSHPAATEVCRQKLPEE
jgi:hypothetical protein